MNLILRLSEEIFTKTDVCNQESLKIMTDFENLKSKDKKSGKIKKTQESSQINYQVRSNDYIKNRKERDFSGTYCRETFKKHKAWKALLSKEDSEENDSGFLIEKPKETYKAFNSIELYDVIGCLKSSRPHYPKAFIVVGKDKDEEILTVIPWHPSWLEQEHTKETISQHYREYAHQNKNINLENKITIEDISLSISLERYAKLYRLDKNTNRFIVPFEDSRRVKILRLVPQEMNKSSEVIA